MLKKASSNRSQSLRNKAEELLLKRALSKQTSRQLSEYESHKLNYELELHEIEHELQNEELQIARSVAEAATKKANPAIIKLKKRERQFSSLVENSPDMIVRFDTNFRYLYCNPVVVRQFERAAKEYIGKTPLEINEPKESAVFIINSLQKAIECNNEIVVEQGLKTPAGEKYFQTRIVPERNGKGEVESLLAVTRDITERKQSEEILMESEELYHTIVNNMGDGFGLVDTNEQFVFANSAGEEIFGVEPGGLVGKRLAELISEDQFMIDLKESELRAQGNKSVYELEILRPTGEKRNIVITAVPHFDKEKTFVGTFGVFRDITDRKQTEIELLAAKESAEINSANLTAIFGSTIDSIWAFNRNYEILYINEVLKQDFYTSFGVHLEPGVNLIESLPEPLRPFWKPRYDKVLNNEQFTFEDAVLTEIGTVYIRVSMNPIVKNGKVIGGSCFGSNITESKRAQQLLLESEERFRNLMGNIEAVAVQGYNPDGTTQYWNKASEKLYGYSSQEAIGSNLLDLIIPSEMKEEVSKAIHEMAESGQPVPSGELLLVRKDGTSVPVISHHAIVKVPGRQQELFCLDIDITQRKQYEKQLQQLNADKDLLMSVLAHDLKSPFSGLLGLSGLLVDNIHTYNIDKIENLAHHINISAKKTYNLLEDLLLWVRSQSGKMPFKPQKLNFADICAEVLETLIPQAQEKNITIYYSVPRHFDVYADDKMLKTILRNLVTNAIKFTRGGGNVTLTSEKINGYVTIIVSDNGIGIPQEILSRLFDISTLHSTDGTSGEKGTGLGLLLCKEFVEKHFGNVHVESEVGRGSTFKFTLPYPA
jgi:PAS domain S-box-containing protein